MICELLSHRLYTKLKLNTGQKGFWWFNPATIRLQLYKNFTILGDSAEISNIDTSIEISK